LHLLPLFFFFPQFSFLCLLHNLTRYIECHEFVLHFFSAAFRLRSEERSAELNKIAMKEKEARDAKKAAEAAEEAANFHILT